MAKMEHQQAPLNYIKRYYEDDVGEFKNPESRFYQKYLKKVKGNSILSVGCGPEFYDDLAFFGQKPKEYIGIDINKSTLKFLKESGNVSLLKAKRKARGIKSEVLVGDILKYNPALRGKFDFVLSIAILGMFKKNDFSKAIKNVRSYLKQGGMFLDIDWTDSSLTKETYIEKERYRFYTKQGPSVKEQGEMIKDNGFRVMKYDQYSPNKKTYQWGRIFVYLAKKK